MPWPDLPIENADFINAITFCNRYDDFATFAVIDFEDALHLIDCILDTEDIVTFQMCRYPRLTCDENNLSILHPDRQAGPVYYLGTDIER